MEPRNVAGGGDLEDPGEVPRLEIPRAPRGNADPGGTGEQERRPEKDFSAYNRELTQQIDPDSGERVQLMTKKQFLKLQMQELKKFE
jgi:hypothetical protein